MLGEVEMHFVLPWLTVGVLTELFGTLLAWVFTEESRNSISLINC